MTATHSAFLGGLFSPPPRVSHLSGLKLSRFTDPRIIIIIIIIITTPSPLLLLLPPQINTQQSRARETRINVPTPIRWNHIPQTPPAPPPSLLRGVQPPSASVPPASSCRRCCCCCCLLLLLLHADRRGEERRGEERTPRLRSARRQFVLSVL